MKIVYLKVRYETNLYSGDFSNGTFYDGMAYIEDDEIEAFLNNFLETKKIKMYPHLKNEDWSLPVFNMTKKKIFDFSKNNVSFVKDTRDPIYFTKRLKDGYKYHYCLISEEKAAAGGENDE